MLVFTILCIGNSCTMVCIPFIPNLFQTPSNSSCIDTERNITNYTSVVKQNCQTQETDEDKVFWLLLFAILVISVFFFPLFNLFDVIVLKVSVVNQGNFG